MFQVQYGVKEGVLLLLQSRKEEFIKAGNLVYNEAIENYSIQTYDIFKSNPVLNTTIKLVKPIIISNTDKIEVNDYITDYSKIWQWKDDCSLLGRKKVLVLPEQFSLQDKLSIIDGTYKASDKVFIKLDNDNNFQLNSNNCVQFEKINKTYTLEQIEKALNCFTDDAPGFYIKKYFFERLNSI